MRNIGLIIIFVLAIIAIIFFISFPALTGNITMKIPEKGYNVILITIDTLRPDHLGCYGYSRETSPNIDRLAEDSFLFENAYSAASWTRSALASLLTSKLPTEHGILSESRKQTLSPGFYTIQEYFNDMGYSTAAFYTNVHLNLGLVQNFSYTHYESNEPAASIYDRVIRWIGSTRNNFFVYIHHNDPHDPYKYHEGFSIYPKDSQYRRLQPFFPTRVDGNGVGCEEREGIVKLNETQLSEMEANYDGEIEYLDYHFGRLLDYLQASRLSENTIVIVSADHGEEFLDHGGYWHGCTLYDELIKVPLIFHIPGQTGSRIGQRVSTMDIFPTLVEMVEGNSTEYGFSGSSLVPIIHGIPEGEGPLYSATAFRGPKKYSIIIGDYKLITQANGKAIGMYNLKDDPEETKDLQGLMPVLLSKVNETLFKEISSHSGKIREDAPEIDQETLEQLKALGYMT